MLLFWTRQAFFVLSFLLHQIKEIHETHQNYIGILFIYKPVERSRH
jgi:hypothetical protein